MLEKIGHRFLVSLFLSIFVAINTEIMAKQKFYVVWDGAEDGVYTSWEACKEAVEGFSGAKYQSFKTEAEAEEAFELGYEKYKERENSKKTSLLSDSPEASGAAPAPAVAAHPAALHRQPG